MSTDSKFRQDSIVDGSISGISHVYFLTGVNSKFFIIEVDLSYNSKDTRKNFCTIVAPIKVLGSKMVTLGQGEKREMHPL